MNKKFYTLFALGTLLFAACSDNASPISGSTNVPNMVNPDNVIVLRSMVLCSQRGKSADSSQDCWDGEMWNSTLRVRIL